MEVPLLDLCAQWARIEDEVRPAIDRVLASGRFVLGPEVEAFETAMAAECGTAHAIGVSSGTDALLCTLMALGIGPGDEVIVPTFTFFATAGAVARLGARPVFVDSEPDTFNLDPTKAVEAITPQTRAIIAVHLFGQCADMEPLRAAVRERGIKLIEDAAQAIGATYNGMCVGTLGDAACLSFFPSKNLGAFGDAGCIVTDDDALAERCRLLRVHGSGHTYRHALLGGNFRLDALQAAILAVKLRHLDEWNTARRDVAARWGALLADAPVTPPAVRAGNTHVYQQYVVRTSQRDAMREALGAVGVATGVYYPIPLHLQPCFADLGGRAGDFPVAEAASREVLALPMYPELTVEAQRFVAEAVGRSLARATVA